MNRVLRIAWCAVLVPGLIGVVAGAPPPDRPPLVGAIRWDVWVGDLGAPRFQHGLWNETALSDPEFHDRIPFYGRIIAPNHVEARCTSQATLDAEIAFAKGALDCWAFLAYPPWSESAPMHTALSLYLASRRKADIRFCIILNGQQWWEHLDTSATGSHK